MPLSLILLAVLPSLVRALMVLIPPLRPQRRQQLPPALRQLPLHQQRKLL
jgi:hypothetical protein